MKGTFTSYSFGCRVNEAEKISLDRKLISSGYVYNEKNPDIFIIYSCAVTGKAEREVRQFIHQTRRNFPKTKIVVTGCAVTRWNNNHIVLPKIDFQIANNSKSSIPDILSEIRIIKKEGNTDSVIYKDKFVNSGRITIKIQDGCSRFCSYCIVPYLRGKPVSRKIGEIVNEINGYGKSIREIILTAVNTQYFGIGNQETLPQLLDAILDQTDVPRVSLGSVHPGSITGQFIKWYEKNSNNSRFIHFLHIPIQSGSDKILELMDRGYRVKDMIKRLTSLHSINPSLLLGTDIIVGFPGESENDFGKTYDFINKSHISKLHVFRYSARSGTKSDDMEKIWGTVLPAEKIRRSEKISLLGRSKYKRFIGRFGNRTVNALFLTSYDKGYQDALSDNQLPVKVKTKKIILPGTIKKVSIASEIKSGLTAAIV